MRSFSFFMLRSFAGLLLTCVCWLSSNSQTVQLKEDPLKLADKYFEAGEYYTAAYLYEQALNPKVAKEVAKQQGSKQAAFPLYAKNRTVKSTVPEKKDSVSTDLLYKQAECYRLAHYWDKAAATYAKCSNNPDALYWKAICERSLEKYDSAEASARKYLGAGHTRFKSPAEKELETIQFIRQQFARTEALLISCKKLSIPESFERGAYAVSYGGGEQYVVSSTRFVKNSDKTTNPNNSRLFYATIDNDSIGKMNPVALPAPALIDNQSAASVSADGKHMYFTQWKRENGKNSSGIYHCEKDKNGVWKTPVLLQGVNFPGANTKQPFCTADGKYLFFSSDRPGGSGGFDIWYALIQPDGNTATSINAGTLINSIGDEQAPFFQNSSSSLVFSSNGRVGMGGYDLYVARRKDSTWTSPENLGYPVNSSRDDVYFYATERSSLLAKSIIGSDRGSGCCIETYRIAKSARYKNLNGIVTDCDKATGVSGADITLDDGTGVPRKLKTGDDGMFSFEGIDFNMEKVTVSISKKAYKDTIMQIALADSGTTDLKADKIYNTSICVDKKFVLDIDNVLTVFFDFDKSYLQPDGVRRLDSLVDVLYMNPTYKIQVSGYTDGWGTIDYNAKLSDRRAKACAAYVMAKGISPNRITFEAFGACCPVEMEIINGRDNPDGRSKNRRALINVVKE